jgi:Subtilase family
MRPPTIRAALAALFALSLAVAIPFSGANAASGTRFTSRLLVIHSTVKPTNSITKAQLIALERNAKQHVIVVLRNQFHSLAGRAHHLVASRGSAIAQAQAPVLHELAQVHARHVLAFRLINAIRATVSAKEAAHLRSDSAVRAVVPDAPIHLAPYYTSDVAAKPSLRRGSVLPKCSTKGTPPELDPEALQVTNTAFLNPKTPQAQNIATGNGVLVGIVSTGVDLFNPDFIRPDGAPVFAGYADFTGNGPGTESGADIEGFIDSSSVGAQGNETYNLNNYVNAAFRKPTDPCHNIKILGMAPGASILWAQAFSSDSASTSTIVQSIQWETVNGANVISESFGSEPTPDTSVDVTKLANDAAIADGATVVVSSGDAGWNGTTGSSSTDPKVISAGASTTFRSYKQVTGQGFELGSGGYLSNNVSSLSSSGPSQDGAKSVDVLAPGDLNWILCSENYPGCTDNDGGPSPIYQSGGTSESAPLIAGEAALVDQAYSDAHNGAMPTPAIVKQIIMSTATDLNEPAVEQGAGLINSYRAVLAARNYGNSKAKGEALLTSPAAITAADAPGTAENLTFTVSNDGKHAQKVSPYPVKLGAPFNVQNYTVTLNPATEPTFVGPGGAMRGYEKQTFTVGHKVDHVDVSIAWNVTAEPGTICYLIVFNPHGKYTAYSIPQGFGSGYAHVDVRKPGAGTWTAVVASRIVGGTAYQGAVQLGVSSSNLVRFATVTPKTATIQPETTKTFTLNTAIPATSGDFTGQVQVIGKASTAAKSVSAGSIPVILRSLVALGGSGGTFNGVLLGTNGRGGEPDYQTWALNVPSGLTDLDASISLSDSNYNITGFLVNPEGQAVDVQSTVTANDPHTGAPTAETNGMQFYYRAPEAGLWHLVLDEIQSSGQQISEPFTGSISFNHGAAGVVPGGVPNDPSTMLPAGAPVTATLAVTNNSGVTENYFVDPRSSQATQLFLGEAQLSLPTPGGVAFVVPPDSTELVAKASSGSPLIPINSDLSTFAGDPDVEGTTQFELPGIWTSTAVVDNPSGSRELAPGYWFDDVQMTGPFDAPTTDVAIVGALVNTQAFAGDVSSTTGDQWQYLTGQTGSPPTPLTLAPGKSGTITVTFTPGESSGTAVSGQLELDTTLPSIQTFGNGGNNDEVAAIPFAYTVK